LIEEEKTIDVKELFLSKLEAIDNIVGLAPETLNTLAKLGEAINNDSNFYHHLIKDLSFKANTADTYRKLETFSDKEVNYKMAQG
jgi:predicted AAA+ superfamily ATPase